MAGLREKAREAEAEIRKSIVSGDFNPYDIGQATMLAANKYTKRLRDYSPAINLLNDVAQALFKASKGSSAGQLALQVVAVYKVAKMAPDATTKGRLLTLLRQFPPDEPSRKKFIGETISWTVQLGEYPAGDPEIHHVAGSLYAQERIISPAEYHLVMGTKDSADILARLHYAWYKENDPHQAPLFCARSVLPYLLMNNLRAANTAYQRFTTCLMAENPNLGAQKIAGKSCEIQVFPSLPLLNFIGFLLLAVQRGPLSYDEVANTESPKKGNSSLFTDLMAQYKSDLEPLGWGGVLDAIAAMYFQIVKQKEFNIMDMMGSMLGGGGMGRGGGMPGAGRGR